MEIKIGIGIDNLVFGMSMDDVKDILGEPDKISDTERTKGIVYTYNDLLTKYKFDEEDAYVLSSIEVHNPKIFMLSQSVINCTKEELEELLERNGFNEFEYEEYDFFEILNCEQISCTFHIEFNRLKSIELTPKFNNDGSCIWPK